MLSKFDPVSTALLLGSLVVSVAAAAPALSATAKIPPPERPNIVFILADDLGYGDLGCYQQAKIKTPNLDRLAKEGVRFTDFYAGSTVCAPSRCALMTGLHTGHAFIRGNANLALRPEDFTVAEVLKGAGYHTGLIGKWGLGNENTAGVPSRKGFDEFAGFLDQTLAHNYYPEHLWRHDPRTGFDGQMPLYENLGGNRKLYVQDLFDLAGLNFIENNQPNPKNRQGPFFLYLAYTLPHANNEEGKLSGNGMQIPSDVPYSNESWPQAEKNKAAMITRLDTDVGKVLDKLKALQLETNTVVIFTSDNGPHKEGGVDPKFFRSSGPWRGIKRDLYEGGIRVPLLVRWPEKIRPGRVSDQVWAFWDILPTLAELAGAKVPGKIDGISMVPTLLGRTQTNQHDFLYWEFHERGFQQAVRMGEWKAVRPQAGTPLELYNLKSDPAEGTDVAEQNPEVIRKIEGYLKQCRTESSQWPVKAPAEKKEATDK
jgi:arylsulfatase A-like enzyme